MNPLSNPQLAMYMTAKELYRSPMIERQYYDSKKAMVEDKLEESKQPIQKKIGGPKEESLYDSIKRSGVQQPVTIAHDTTGKMGPFIDNGHHRVIAAHNINPNMLIPVRHVTWR